MQPNASLWPSIHEQYKANVRKCINALQIYLLQLCNIYTYDDDCFYYHSWRNKVVIAFGTLSSFYHIRQQYAKIKFIANVVCVFVTTVRLYIHISYTATISKSIYIAIYMHIYYNYTNMYTYGMYNNYTDVYIYIVAIYICIETVHIYTYVSYTAPIGIYVYIAIIFIANCMHYATIQI